MSTSSVQGKLFAATQGPQREEDDGGKSSTDRGVARLVDSARGPVGTGKASTGINVTPTPSTNSLVTKTFATRVPIGSEKNTPPPSTTYTHQRTPVGKRK
ncbi:MAG: hypothetical protein K1060chlam3_00807 [Candidatus Anoxychlamydiales bacterium]|nr:hypothetical protein [Candidatus Anoxychlamydiales bacterium]